MRKVMLTGILAANLVAGCSASGPSTEPPAPSTPAATLANSPTVSPAPTPTGTPGPTAATAGSPSAVPTIAPGATGGPIIDVPIGACFNEVRGAEGRISALIVSCDGPHQLEMIGYEVLPDDPNAPYPGDGAMSRAGNRLCRPLFEEYVGMDYDNSRLVFWYFVPDEVLWPLGHRLVECTIGNEDRSMQPPGSVRNSRR
jgi:hypothetical protein